ncbi:MAG: hypothetical protein ACK48C_08420 [Roseiflexaceae bacterium]|jgi:hypothetical protein
MQDAPLSAQPDQSAHAPLLRPSTPLTDASATNSLPPPDIIPTTPLGHLWAFMGIAVGFYIAYTSWTGSAPSDDWGRRWILVAIPSTATIGLWLGWRTAWQTICLAMTCIYLGAPFIAARVESCLLPIPDAVPCFADNTIVLDVASRLAHPIYYPVLIAVHLAGACFVWSFVATNGGQNYVAASSPRPSVD